MYCIIGLFGEEKHGVRHHVQAIENSGDVEHVVSVDDNRSNPPNSQMTCPSYYLHQITLQGTQMDSTGVIASYR